MPTTSAIQKLERDLTVLGELCENAVSTAIMALIDRSEEMATQVIETDSEIDEMELTVDADCLRLLEEGGLAGERLRFVTAAMKINNDMERIGDLAVEICEHVLFLVERRTVLSRIVDFQALVEQISQILQESIRALVDRDSQLAWKIIDEHLVVHDEASLIWTEIVEVMRESPLAIERCCHILQITRCLERVADLATNIAEEVLYLNSGETVRHHIKEHHPVDSSELPGDASSEMEAHEEELVGQHSERVRTKGRKPSATTRKL